MTHWKKLTNPDYLGAYALEPGKDIIATIASVKNEMVVGPDGKKEECSVMRFVEREIKPMILNVTNAKTIQKIYKTPYVESWVGKKVQIYVAEVKAFGEVVDALRIRPFIPKSDSHKCENCGAEIVSENGVTAAQTIKTTIAKYGKQLCFNCAVKAKEAAEQARKEGDVLSESNEDHNS